MSARFDMSRVVRSWLREDEHDSAEHILEVVIARLDTTPQRRSLWPPRRSTLMSNPVRIALAAAAVLIVAFVGLRLLPASSIGPGAPTAAPSTMPTPAPTASATATGPAALPLSGVVPAGTYRVVSFTNTPFNVTLPAGWTSSEGSLSKGTLPPDGTGVLFAPWVVTHVYGDSCSWRGTIGAIGPTKAEMVAALTAQTGRNVNGPTETTYGGLPATEFVFPVASDFDASVCNDGFLRIWPNTGGTEDGGIPNFPGNTVTVSVVETGGRATAIVTLRHVDSPAAAVAELQSILESVVFVP